MRCHRLWSFYIVVILILNVSCGLAFGQKVQHAVISDTATYSGVAMEKTEITVQDLSNLFLDESDHSNTDIKVPVGQPSPTLFFNALIGGRENAADQIPDTQGAVGPDHVMVMLNDRVAIWERKDLKKGNFDPCLVTELNKFWNHFSQSIRPFDPKLLYDPYDKRWIATVLTGGERDSNSSVLAGVSKSSDPLGEWYLYYIDLKEINNEIKWIDKPTIGFNKKWIVLQANAFYTNNPYLIASSSIDDWSSFYTTLYKNVITGGQNPSVRLWKLMPKELQDEIKNNIRTFLISPSLTNTQDLISKTIKVLNTLILPNMWFYDRIYFQGLDLPERAFELLGYNRRNLYEDEVIELNRLVLQASFNGLIRPVSIDSSPGTNYILVFKKNDLYDDGEGDYSLFEEPYMSSSKAPAMTYDDSLSIMYLVEQYRTDDKPGLRIAALRDSAGVLLYYPGIDILFSPKLSGWAFRGNENEFAPQDESQKINVGNSSIQNVVYRDRWIWATQTVFLPADNPTRCSIQWWKIRATGLQNIELEHAGRIDDPNNEWFYARPSIAVNKNNSILIGYSSFSANTFPSANYTYFKYDNLPISTNTTVRLKPGNYEFTFNKPRWGDYSSTVIDPNDSTAFWTLQEYATSYTGYSSGSTKEKSKWGTYWGFIKPNEEK